MKKNWNVTQTNAKWHPSETTTPATILLLSIPHPIWNDTVWTETNRKQKEININTWTEKEKGVGLSDF